MSLGHSSLFGSGSWGGLLQTTQTPSAEEKILLNTEEGSQGEVLSKHAMYLKLGDEHPAQPSAVEPKSLFYVGEKIEREEGSAAKLRDQSLQHLRRSNRILTALVLLLLVATPAAIWFVMCGKFVPEERLQALSTSLDAEQAARIADNASQTALLQAYGQRLDTQHLEFTQAVAAVQQSLDADASDRASSMAAFDEKAAAVNKSMNAFDHRMGATRSEWEGTVASVKTSIKTVNERLDAEHAKQAGDIAAVTHSVERERTNRAQAIKEIQQRMDQDASDQHNAISAVRQMVDSETSNRTQAIQAVSEQLSKERTDRSEAVAGLDQRVDSTEAKIKGGICTFCFSCGGKWPVYMGEVESTVKFVKRHGKECEGGFETEHGLSKNNFCCATA